jgi:hypothetical protein
MHGAIHPQTRLLPLSYYDKFTLSSASCSRLTTSDFPVAHSDVTISYRDATYVYIYVLHVCTVYVYVLALLYTITMDD